MKKTNFPIPCFLMLCVCFSAHGQGTFQNLGFESFQANAPFSGAFAVTLGGQTLSLVPLLVTPSNTLFGADIHSWAGQAAELRFTEIADRPHHVNEYLFLDSIQFSDQFIPEP